jgi:hypothetical protein
VQSPVSRLPLDGLRPDEAEAVIAGLPGERSYFYDAGSRQVAIFEGAEGYVFFDLDERERRRVEHGLLIHNHPPHIELPRYHPRYDADSFSPADWHAAVDLNLAMLVAVSPSLRHELIRPAAGWLAVHSPDWLFFDQLASLYTYIAGEDAKVTGADEVSELTAEATLAHRVNENFAREIGATYRREQR